MPESLHQFVLYCVQSFVLGIIQGVTEFLPISSTAHLKVIPYYFGWPDPGISISASLQLGSGLAIVFYFRHDISILIKSLISILTHRKLFNDENTTLVTYIFIASIPILICGLFVKLFWTDFSNSYFRSLTSIAIISILMALLLALAEIYGEKKKLFYNINLRDIVFIGLSQSLAIFPGVSRSGITLTSALFAGIKRHTAAKISFLVGIPAISISGLVEFYSLFQESSNFEIIPTLIGIISSFFSSIIAIDLLIKYLAKNKTFIFVYYRLAFGLFILSTL